jgi:hypothetical protein
MSHLRYEHQAEGLDSYALGLQVVVVLVRAGETEAHAWRRHVRENPKDSTAKIKIFHIDTQGSS